MCCVSLLFLIVFIYSGIEVSYFFNSVEVNSNFIL
jgi:hypothetical protein